MEIKEKIEQDFKQALKAKDRIAVSTLRMLKSALHNKEIEKQGEKLTEGEVVKVIAKQVQQHRDSIEQFAKGKRQDLVEKETQELQVLKTYLPEQLSPEKIKDMVQRIITESTAKDKSDFGRVMKLVMAEIKGRADGKLVSQMVSAELNQNHDQEK